ncbi:MAG: hypothetical protein FWF96_02595 [Kiritimatiellaeota bacterium]|nr:hypothetical protein [Kiritimatiellota bacterium]
MPLPLRLSSLKSRLGPLWWHAALLFVAARMGDVASMFVGLVLVPRFVAPQALGALQPVMNFSAVYTLPLGILFLAVPKFLNVFAARGETGKARALLSDVLLVSGLYTLLMAGFIFLTGDAILLRLRLGDRHMLWFVAGFAILATLTPVLASAQQAFKCFRSTVVATAAGPWARFALMLALLPFLGATGWLLASLGTSLFVLAIPGVALALVLRKLPGRASYRENLGEMSRYMLPLLLGALAGRVQAPIESLVVRQRLAEEVSAGYFFVTMFGMIPVYFTGAITPFLWVMVSEKFERGEKDGALMWQSLAFNFAVGGAVVLGAAVFAPLIFKVPGDWPWKPYAGFSKYIWAVCLLNVIRGGPGIFTAGEAACRRFAYMRYTIPCSLLCSALLYIIPGWGFFEPWLPAPLWQSIAGLLPPVSLGSFIGVMLATSLLNLVGVALQLVLRHGKGTRTQ